MAWDNPGLSSTAAFIISGELPLIIADLYATAALFSMFANQGAYG